MTSQHQLRVERLLAEQGPVYKMDLCYIGTQFSGFQSQVDGQAVQDHLERALATVLRHPVRIRGASRTDSGVHAEQQVAVFRTKLPFSRRWLLGVNALVPPDIGVRSLEPVANDFDPIFASCGKAYRYRLWRGRCFSPFIKPFVWALPYEVDLGLMREAASQLVGRRDFAGFCARDSDAKTTIRHVYDIAIDERGPLVDVWVSGEGFLKQMVRIMVGTLVETAARKLPASQIATVLASGRRELAGLTAPARGLSLVAVYYDEPQQLAAVRERAARGFCMPLGDALEETSLLPTGIGG